MATTTLPLTTNYQSSGKIVEPLLCIMSAVFFIYVWLYPPFIFTPLVDPAIRLVMEGGVLLSLASICLYHRPGKIPKVLLMAVALTLLYGMFNQENIRHLLSFFNKLFFIILLVKALERNYQLTSLIKGLWVFMWCLLAISAIIGSVGFATGLISFSKSDLFFVHERYIFNPVFGQAYRIGLPAVLGPNFFRYVGWLVEPGDLGFFFGINIFLSTDIFINSHRARYFRWLNVIAGLLTFSMAFYFFIIPYFFYAKCLSGKVIPTKVVLWMIVLSIAIIGYATIDLQKALLPVAPSLPTRTLNLQKTLESLPGLDLKSLVFGMGVEPYCNLEDASHGGMFRLLLGLGLLVFTFFVFLMYKYTKNNFVFFLFIFYYSIFFNILWNPLLFLGVALGYAYSFHKKLGS